MKLFLVFLSLIAVASLTFGPFTGSASAQSGGSIGIRPANPDPNNPRTESIFVKRVTPAQTITDQVEVINNTNESADVIIYATDAIISSGGAFACAQQAEDTISAGGWIELAQTELQIPANSETIVDFTITPPSNADAGENNACIVVAKRAQNTGQGGVNLSFRTALRVAILAPGPVIKNLENTDFRVQVTRDSIVMTPKIRNSGTVSVDATVTARLITPSGAVREEISNTYPVLKGEDSQWNSEFERPFWGGIYKAQFSLSYDQSENFLGDGSATTDVITKDGPTRWIIVWPRPAALVLQLFLLGLITGGIGWALYRRHERNITRQTWKNHTIKEHETLESLSLKYGTSWKTLAHVNRLKPPYQLKAGEQLRVPPHAAKSSQKKSKKVNAAKNE